VAQRPVWAGAKNLATTGIGSPDRPARSKPRYRPSYSGPGFSPNISLGPLIRLDPSNDNAGEQWAGKGVTSISNGTISKLAAIPANPPQ
jgi:hypothetical protein